MNWKALVVAVTLVVSAAGTPVAAATAANTGQQTSGQVQTGTYVSFEATDDAVVDYTVNGKTVVDSMSVQSTSEAKSQSSGGLGLGGSVFAGAGLSVANTFSADASTQATIQAESGAEIVTHDNDRGIVVVTSNGESHVARFNGTDDSEAEKESEKRAVITNDDGATATVIVVGDGNVTVSDSGNVTAMAEEDGRVVYRQYEGERSDSEKQQERMIANGTAVAEVYVQAAGDAASEAGDDDSTPTATDTATATPTEAPSEEARERSADVVRYSEDTTVEVTENAAGTFNATVERSQSEGKVVIMSVSEAAFEGAESAEDLEVYVDGEAAAQAESYSALKAATNDGDTSKYLVRSSSSAQASSDVVVGINHFSERQVSMQSDGGSDDGGSTESGGQPGFGVGIAVVALVGAALLARRQR
ncbi:PGF-CTERM sorting domain-containing protein [Haloglomus litoreum]|uniref:PGF-CTERM sorting domain-containing protein n=1 Tax=Haloglomus litoreum TaxID=3034026 RepID=UPI0023E86D50|nr:PGF-CTERM sorting domain-containing protein [Haloglomus sp. DT116]